MKMTYLKNFMRYLGLVPGGWLEISEKCFGVTWRLGDFSMCFVLGAQFSTPTWLWKDSYGWKSEMIPEVTKTFGTWWNVGHCSSCKSTKILILHPQTWWLFLAKSANQPPSHITFLEMAICIFNGRQWVGFRTFFAFATQRARNG